MKKQTFENFDHFSALFWTKSPTFDSRLYQPPQFFLGLFWDMWPNNLQVRTPLHRFPALGRIFPPRSTKKFGNLGNFDTESNK